MLAEVDKMLQECAGIHASHDQPLPHSSAETSRQAEALNLRMDPFPKSNMSYIQPDPTTQTHHFLQLSNTYHGCGLQANSAPTVQWLNGPHTVPHGLRNYHCFSKRRRSNHGKIFHHGCEGPVANWYSYLALLALLSLNKLLRKRTETDVAFTLEYSRVSNPRGTIKHDQT